MKKVFILGIDGGSLNLIESWINLLPSFKRFFHEGTRGKLETTIPPLTPSAWTSFMTGTSPKIHGVLDFYRLDENFRVRISTRNRRIKTLWRILSENRKKVISLAVPFTYPPEPVNGIMVSGFLTPSIEAEFTYPSSFKEELLRNVPEYMIIEDVKYTENNKEAFMDAIFRMMDARIKAMVYLMEKYPWDVFMVTFMGVDHAQHWFWKYMDPTHPRYVKEDKLSEAILKTYQKIDKVLGYLMDHLPSETTLIIMSDHGGGPCYGSVNLNYYLAKRGFLKIKKGSNTGIKKLLYALGITPSSLTGIAMHLPTGKAMIKIRGEKRTKLASFLGLTYQDIDPEHSLAYSFGYYGPIYINTRKRNPIGCVKDSDYEKIREEVLSSLLDIKDPITGERLITRWWMREEIYGENWQMPDIIIEMRKFAYTASIFAFPSMSLFLPSLTMKSGEHTLYGIFGARGDGIPEGEKLEGCTILDILPTVLSIMGITPPPYIEGKNIFNR